MNTLFIKPLTAALIALTAAFGCAPNGNDDPDAASADTTQETDDPLSTTGDTATSGAAPGRFAKGVQIARVEANQGVAVPLTDGTRVIAPSDRNVGLIRGRTTLIRVFWTLDVTFTPRDILANLVLTESNGETRTIQSAMFIKDSPDPETMDGAFHFLLSPEDVTPDLQFHVELKETAHSDLGTALPDKGARVPAEGTADLGIIDAPMSLNMVLAPLTPPNAEAVSVSSADKTQVETALMELTPVQEITVAWHAPVPQSRFYEHPEEAWADIYDLRDALGLRADQYLHVLLNPSDCCAADAFDFTGLGGNPGATTSRADSEKRSAMVMIKEDVGRAATFIVHELGHNHGLKHAPCGDVDDVDGAYPYAGGLTGTFGYGILSEKLYSGDPNIIHPYCDMMTYCWPVWYSDYNFEALRRRVATVSSFDL